MVSRLFYWLDIGQLIMSRMLHLVRRDMNGLHIIKEWNLYYLVVFSMMFSPKIFSLVLLQNRLNHEQSFLETSSGKSPLVGLKRFQSIHVPTDILIYIDEQMYRYCIQWINIWNTDKELVIKSHKIPRWYLCFATDVLELLDYMYTCR